MSRRQHHRSDRKGELSTEVMGSQKTAPAPPAGRVGATPTNESNGHRAPGTQPREAPFFVPPGTTTRPPATSRFHRSCRMTDRAITWGGKRAYVGDGASPARRGSSHLTVIAISLSSIFFHRNRPN